MKARSTAIDFSRNVPEQVSEWLEEAGHTLAALPATGLRPARAGSGWPDIVRDLDDLDCTRESDDWPIRPSADAVSRMDQVLNWIGLFGPDERNYRMVINMRLIVHPISGLHRWSWQKIARKLGTDHKRAQDWYQAGIGVIVKKISQPEIFSSQKPQNILF
ncbi:DUF6362 family protein [Acetobacter syzygii]|uniref:DUF6362 family protein n=1 Tax=Acetobacter syzygii TaxID=146476 RepID=UPI00156EE31A|nr:DUF6362 family protein [Acetobacter syzygii]NSL92927.1 hypothetical protein [Acetobacter syzygii]